MRIISRYCVMAGMGPQANESAQKKGVPVDKQVLICTDHTKKLLFLKFVLFLFEDFRLALREPHICISSSVHAREALFAIEMDAAIGPISLVVTGKNACNLCSLAHEKASLLLDTQHALTASPQPKYACTRHSYSFPCQLNRIEIIGVL